MEKSEKVLVLSSIILVGFVIGVVFHYILGYYLHKPFPGNTFLFRPDQAFTDFTIILSSIKNLAPFSQPNFMINYFPLAYILLFPFTLIKNPLLAFLIFTFIFLSFFIFSNVKMFQCKNLTKLQNFQNIFILSILPYPFLMLLDRGNFDMFLFILFAIFIYSFKSEKFFLSSIILAIINGIKPFTLIFLFLFLFKKKYKEFFLSIIIMTSLILGGFMFLRGPFFNQISTFITNLTLFKQSYVYLNNNVSVMIGGSSLFIVFRLFCINLIKASLMPMKIFILLYNILSLIITTIVIFFTYRENFFWKQITLLTLTMLLLPYIVFDYKLIFLFIPIWLFVNSKEKSQFDLIYTILFGLLFIPKSIIITNPIPWPEGLFFLSMIANPIIMLLFIGLIIFEQFHLKQKEPKE